MCHTHNCWLLWHIQEFAEWKWLQANEWREFPINWYCNHCRHICFLIEILFDVAHNRNDTLTLDFLDIRMNFDNAFLSFDFEIFNGEFSSYLEKLRR